MSQNCKGTHRAYVIIFNQMYPISILYDSFKRIDQLFIFTTSYAKNAGFYFNVNYKNNKINIFNIKL